MLIVVCYSLLSANVYANDGKVVIVNGATSHCRPDPSCYTPYKVDVSVGDRVTWLNQDNETHTVTTGTANYGPEGVFDSGVIQPGHSFTQFFGTEGKYRYYDKTDMWSSGLIVVSKGFSHAELEWISESLKIEKQNYTSNGIVITKEIKNTGNADAHAIIFTLKIKNQTNLLYNNVIKLDIPVKQTVPVKFTWDNPANGQYQLFFDANSANTAGDMNANNDRSFDLISIPSSSPTQSVSITNQNFTMGTNDATITEFGSTSYLVLIMSVVTIITLSVKDGLRI